MCVGSLNVGCDSDECCRCRAEGVNTPGGGHFLLFALSPALPSVPQNYTWRLPEKPTFTQTVFHYFSSPVAAETIYNIFSIYYSV